MTEPARLGSARLSRLISWGVLGQTFYVLSQFIILLSLARFTTPESVGAFGLATAIAVPVTVVAQLGLRINRTTDVDGTFGFAAFLKLRLVACVFATICFVIIAALLPDGSASRIVLIFGAAKTVELVSDVCYGSFQKFDKMDLVAKSQILRGLLSSVLFLGLLYADCSAEMAFLAQLIAWSGVAAFIDYPLARALSAQNEKAGPSNWASIYALAKSSVGVGLTQGLASLHGSIPRFSISTFLGLAALGQFSVVAYVFQAMVVVIQAVSQTVMARLSLFIRAGLRDNFFGVIKKLLALIIVLGAVMVLIAFLFGDFLVVVVFGSEYDGLGTLLTLIMIAAVVQSCNIILNAGLQSARLFTLTSVLRFGFLIVLSTACFSAASFNMLDTVVMAMIAVFLFETAVLSLALRRIAFGPEPQTG